MIGLAQSTITDPAVHPDPRRARADPRARPLRDRALGEGPRARVRHRLPAAGEGPRPGQARPGGRRRCRRPPPAAPARDRARLARGRTPSSPTAARLDAERAGTLYTLNWLPIGGFVKLEGEDGDDANDPRSFARARLPIKMGILIAGVTMNLLLAFVIFTGIALWGEPAIGVTIGDGRARLAGGSGRASSPGDTIVTINGKQYSAFEAPGPGDRRPPGARRRRPSCSASSTRTGRPRTSRVTLRVPTRRRSQGALGISSRDRRRGRHDPLHARPRPSSSAPSGRSTRSA